MKRAFKVTAQLAIGLGIAIAGLGIAALGPVDTTKPDGKSYQRVTDGMLQGIRRKAGSAEAAPLQAGFGRAKLTPTLGVSTDRPERGEFRALPLAGYGNRRGAPATGVHDDLWVKAMAVASAGTTCVVVTADALIVPRDVADEAAAQVRTASGLARAQLYFGATHTHCGPGGWAEGLVGEAFAGGFQPGVRTWMARQLATAALDAIRDLHPASFGTTSFDASDFTRNRLVGDRGRIDPEFSLLLMRQETGRQAVLGSYSAHATVLSGRYLKFSGDYPGFWARAVEDATDGMALFLAGGVGSHSPKPPAEGLEGAQSMGVELARRSLDALAGLALTNQALVRMEALGVELPPLQPRVMDGIRLRSWAARQLLHVRSDTLLQVLRLGESVWLSTPCDYSGELALDLKAAAREAGLRAVVTSFNGDYIGYVVPTKYYHLDEYETRTMSFFGPQLPGYFDGLLRSLLAAVSPTSGNPELREVPPP